MIGEPYASGLADPDGDREGCRRVERSRRHGADHRDELEELAQAVSEHPPGEGAAADRTAELGEGAPRPRYPVARRKRAQHDGEDAGETAHSDDGDRDSTGAGGGGAVAVDQRTRLPPDPIGLGLGAREVQRLERTGSGLLQDAPQHFEPEVMRRKSVFRDREVDRDEARPRAAKRVELPALIGERPPQCVRYHGIGQILCSTRVRISRRMARPGGIETMQPGLRDHHRPIGMAAARLLERAHNRVLNRVRNLHHRQQKV